jgi:LAS superfamily LD-carboxypeptidase LdcB
VTISPDQKHDRAVKGQAALSRLFDQRAGDDRELADRLRREHFSKMGKRSGSRRRAKAAARRAAELAALAQRYGLTLTSESELADLARQQALGTPAASDPDPRGSDGSGTPASGGVNLAWLMSKFHHWNYPPVTRVR